MTHGGTRRGAGRPPGSIDPSATRHVWRYRATDDEEGRRIAAGMTTTERIRTALALLAQHEDAGGLQLARRRNPQETTMNATHVTIAGVNLYRGAAASVEETGVDPSVDVDRVRRGLSSDELLAECLDGADDDRHADWVAYVDAIMLAAAETAD